VISFRSVGGKQKQKWVWVGLAALAAIQLYYVQEMLAALLLFSILFVFVSAVVLVLILMDRGIYRTLVWAETSASRARELARHGWALAEQFSKRQLHRLQPAKNIR
jgi:hypothetical protein